MSNSTASRPKSVSLWKASSLGVLLSTSLLTGCQPKTESTASVDNTDAQLAAENSEPAAQSDSAAAYIKQLQPVYIEQALGLQRRLQAEYESLQAADMTDLTENTTTSIDTSIDNVAADGSQAADASNPALKNTIPMDAASVNDNSKVANTSLQADTANRETAANESINLNTDASKVGADASVNTNIQAGARDLTVLRSISFEPQKPTMLTDKQISKRYEQAIKALYQPASIPLDSEETDTLINIAALVPQLFEHTELATRLDAKSPALARLIVQHQVWEQIEARQAKYMEQMKLNQQQEFESLMTKFNDTIKDYDEQIAKYEQTLKEFQ